MYKHITDSELLKTIDDFAKDLRERTLSFLDLLSEANERKLYCDLGYASLFKYIVDELKFSESQAAIYNNLIKSRIVEIVQVKELIKSGELTLFNASTVGKVIREKKVEGKVEQLKLVESFKGLSKDKAMERSQQLLNKEATTTKEVIHISKAFKKDLERVKVKLNLSNDMNAEELLKFLVASTLCEDEEIPENKTITPKTRQILMTRAKNQCQHPNCQATKYLEVDHIMPVSLGGSNHPDNLRIYCREHNQKAAMDRLGRHIVKKRTLPGGVKS